jgi:hypothetical protein
MTVEVVQGNPYPQTSLRVKPKQTPLSDDNASVEKWLLNNLNCLNTLRSILMMK